MPIWSTSYELFCREGECERRELVLYCSNYNSQLLLLVIVLLCLEFRLRVMCFTDIIY